MIFRGALKVKLEKLIELSEEAKREQSVRDDNPGITDADAKKQAKQGLTDVPATDATKVVEEDDKLKKGETGWVYIGMISEKDIDTEILSGTITTSSKKKPSIDDLIYTEKPVTLRDGPSSINTKRLGYLKPGFKLKVTKLKETILIGNGRGIWAEVVISEIGSS